MIYLDNAATTLIKPRAVIEEMTDCLKYYCANSGRGGHNLSIYAGEKIYRCRELLAQLFNIENPANIAFTSNTTTALNYAIKGYLRPNDHVVISGMEHNSVLRPVVHSGCSYTIAKADDSGLVTVGSVQKAIRQNTRLIVINHASNVVGTINPITEIGKIAKSNNIPLLVDAAQTAGVIGIDVERDNISMLAFAGHKMLYGPTGTGGLYVSPKIRLKTIVEGGTGTMSASYKQPDFMPDMLESGTLNTVGIVGLMHGVSYVLGNTTEQIHKNETELVNHLNSELLNIEGVKIYGNDNRVGVVGFLIDGMDSVKICEMLNDEYDIAARCGLHCAILAHKSLGTENTGLARLSVSNFTSMREIDKAIFAVSQIAKGKILSNQ